MGVADDQLGANKPARLQAAQELHPKGLGFRRTKPLANDFVPPIGVGRNGDFGGHRDDPPTLSHLEIGGVEPDMGPFASERSVEELIHPFIDVLTQL